MWHTLCISDVVNCLDYLLVNYCVLTHMPTISALPSRCINTCECLCVCVCVCSSFRHIIAEIAASSAENAKGKRLMRLVTLTYTSIHTQTNTHTHASYLPTAPPTISDDIRELWLQNFLAIKSKSFQRHLSVATAHFPLTRSPAIFRQMHRSTEKCMCVCVCVLWGLAKLQALIKCDRWIV